MKRRWSALQTETAVSLKERPRAGRSALLLETGFCLLRANVRGLRHLRPALEFAGDVASELLRRARRGRESDALQPLDDRLLLERLVRVSVQALDDLARRPRRRHQTKPGIDVEVGDS